MQPWTDHEAAIDADMRRDLAADDVLARFTFTDDADPLPVTIRGERYIVTRDDALTLCRIVGMNVYDGMPFLDAPVALDQLHDMTRPDRYVPVDGWDLTGWILPEMILPD